MWKQANTELVQTNLTWLRQAIDLTDKLDDAVFATKVGAHLRHIVEFYECFLNGLEMASVDYDRRKRDESIEKNRHRAIARMRSLMRRLAQAGKYDDDALLAVRMEGSDSTVLLRSSVARELQALSSHTVHHFALIAMTLKSYGVEVSPSFGVSPSTLRYEARKAAAEAA
jgi:uncharacterized damage-inducible protein DinB